MTTSRKYRASEPAIPEPAAPGSTRNFSGGRFGAGGGFTSAAGGFSNNGKWSQQSLASQPVPAGGGGFQSARGLVGQNNFGVFRTPSSSAPQPSTTAPPPAVGAYRPLRTVVPQSNGNVTGRNPAAFRPPIANPTGLPPPPKAPTAPPRYLAPREQPNGIPSLPAFSTAPSNGPPKIVETRASMIRDAVLVNPTLSAPTINPSTQRDLLSSFQSAESKQLDGYKLGGPSTLPAPSNTIDLTQSSDPPQPLESGLKRPPMSPKRPAKKAKK